MLPSYLEPNYCQNCKEKYLPREAETECCHFFAGATFGNFFRVIAVWRRILVSSLSGTKLFTKLQRILLTPLAKTLRRLKLFHLQRWRLVKSKKCLQKCPWQIHSAIEALQPGPEAPSQQVLAHVLGRADRLLQVV